MRTSAVAFLLADERTRLPSGSRRRMRTRPGSSAFCAAVRCGLDLPSQQQSQRKPQLTSAATSPTSSRRTSSTRPAEADEPDICHKVTAHRQQLLPQRREEADAGRPQQRIGAALSTKCAEPQADRDLIDVGSNVHSVVKPPLLPHIVDVDTFFLVAVCQSRFPLPLLCSE
jgi:hypothetical protein